MLQLTKCTKKQLQIIQDEVNMFQKAKLVSVSIHVEKDCSVQIDQSETKHTCFRITPDGKIFMREYWEDY